MTTRDPRQIRYTLGCNSKELRTSPIRHNQATGTSAISRKASQKLLLHFEVSFHGAAATPGASILQWERQKGNHCVKAQRSKDRRPRYVIEIRTKTRHGPTSEGFLPTRRTKRKKNKDGWKKGEKKTYKEEKKLEHAEKERHWETHVKKMEKQESGVDWELVRWEGTGKFACVMWLNYVETEARVYEGVWRWWLVYEP